MTDVNELIKLVAQFVGTRDWGQFHNPKNLSISLVLEAAEFMEHFQWKNENEIRDYILTHREEVEDELADVFYMVLLIAHTLDANLPLVLKRKLAKNAAKYPVTQAKGRHAKYTELEGAA